VTVSTNHRRARNGRDSEGPWSILLRNFRFPIISPIYQALVQVVEEMLMTVVSVSTLYGVTDATNTGKTRI